MLINIRYIGKSRYFETIVTGAQQSWAPGQSSYVPDNAVPSYMQTGLFEVISRQPVFVKSGSLVTADGDPVSAGAGAGGTYDAASGTLVAEVGGVRYAMLPLDASNNVKANVVPRTGHLADLLTLSGGAGEIASADDADAIVKFTGVSGGARAIRRLDNDVPAGTNALAIGPGASVLAGADGSVAFGPNAYAAWDGQFAFGSGDSNRQASRTIQRFRTTNATARQMTSSGTLATMANSIAPGRPCLVSVKVTVIGRKVGADECCRMTREALALIAAGNMVTLPGPATTVGTDMVTSGLTGVSVDVWDDVGFVAIAVKGLAGTTIEWLATVETLEMAASVSAT